MPADQLVISKSDDGGASGRERPSNFPEVGRFPDRLKQVIGTESVRSFGRRSGVSDTVLRKYLAGESEPTRPALASMAHAAGISLEWLATGLGEPIRHEPASDKASQPVRREPVELDKGLMARAVKISEEVLQEHGLRQYMSAGEFSDFVAIVYDDLQRGVAEDAASALLSRILVAAQKPHRD